MSSLIIVFVVLVLGFVMVAWFGWRQKQSRLIKQQQRNSSNSTQHQAIDFGDYLSQEMDKQDDLVDSDSDTKLVLDKVSLSQQQQAISDVSQTSSQVEAANEAVAIEQVEAEIVQGQYDESIIALTVMAKPGLHFTGREIESALQRVDMRLGELGIYHRIDPVDLQLLFSVANLFKPGVLTEAAMTDLTTSGLIIFMRLPCKANGLQVFDAMLTAADVMAKQLNGVIRDGARQELTEDTLYSLRSRLLSDNLTERQQNQQFSL